MTFEVGLAGGGGVESAKKVEESAFAATTGASNGHNFTGEDFEGNSAECVDRDITRQVGFVEITSFKHGDLNLRDK